MDSLEKTNKTYIAIDLKSFYASVECRELGLDPLTTNLVVADLMEFLSISGYRYETLHDTLEYIKYLWDMTQNYVNSALEQFESLKADVTSKSVDSLTIVTSMSAGAALLGLFTEAEPEFTTFGFVYFFILALLGWGSQKLLSYLSNKRRYDVTDVDFEKNIK